MKKWWRLLQSGHASDVLYCHFCQRKTAIDSNSLICPDCGQYNGLEYKQLVNSQDAPFGSKRFCVPLKENSHRPRSNLLCLECTQKQELWRKAIANISSWNECNSNDEMQLTNYEKQELERIQQTYGLCRFCEAIVRQRLSWIDQQLSNQRLNLYMARSSHVKTTQPVQENSCKKHLPSSAWLVGWITAGGLFCFLLAACVGWNISCIRLPTKVCLLQDGLHLLSTQAVGTILWWFTRLAIIYSIYKSIRSKLFYPYLFCYCTVSSFLLCRKWLRFFSSFRWIYEGWIGGLYILLWTKRIATNTTTARNKSPNQSLDTSHVTDRLYQLPRALSTLSLNDDDDSCVQDNQSMNDQEIASGSSSTLVGWNDRCDPISTFYNHRLISLCRRWKSRLYRYQKATLLVLFFGLRILRYLYLSFSIIEWVFAVTSWMVLFLLWLHPCVQLVHCYQQIVYQTAYNPFDSRLCQQWKHPLRNSFLVSLFHCGWLAYFMLTLAWRDILPWVEMAGFHTFSLGPFTAIFSTVFQEYGIRIGILVAIGMGFWVVS